MLKQLKLSGFKSFARPSTFEFSSAITAIVGPNGSGKSNIAESFRFALGEQSIKSLRGKRGEDLIWSGSKASPRGNRAGVSITFDNASRFLDMDFDEVVVERVVHRDGVNDYLLNGTQVRLKDVAELLAGANIGETGHHIISQGEADRILSANPRERRGMIEESLGLKVFQYKKEESSRKLEKTKENITQVVALRREVAPHLAFLKRQMDKIEKTEALRSEFSQAMREYLKRESLYLASEKARLAKEAEGPSAELARVRRDVSAARAGLAKKEKADSDAHELVGLGRDLERVRAEKTRLARESGKLEGQIAFAEEAARSSLGAPVPRKDVEAFVREAQKSLDETTALSDVSKLVSLVRSLIERARALLAGEVETRRADVSKLKSELERLSAELAKLLEEEARLVAAHESIRARIESAKDESHELERSVFSLMSQEQDLMHRISALESELARLALVEEEFARDVAEAKALVGEALAYESAPVPADAAGEARVEQERRKRSLEKIKIRLEEFGGGSDEEVRKEFKEVSEREEFLEKELADLEVSAQKLAELIIELDEQIDTRFAKGLASINAEFGKLFAIMFDGGSASLSRVKERKVRRGGMELSLEDGEEVPEDETGEEVVEGIEVQVSLPRKRIKGLVMLSGGERALTSIALIFAMASVNPPPFLVLDETDAALDEANSRRYGDMLETLAAKSQLIVITHNRETMSRAGVLYGVTMGSDGVSKVLSVKFEEAVAVAK